MAEKLGIEFTFADKTKLVAELTVEGIDGSITGWWVYDGKGNPRKDVVTAVPYRYTVASPVARPQG